MISLNHISLSFGERQLLKDISFQINTRDRIGLVGNNGSGKTTLLRIIYGELSPDMGTVERPSDHTTGYLPQQMKHIDSRTLFNEAKTAFYRILDLENKQSLIKREIEEGTDYHSSRYLDLINRLTDINARMEALGISKINEQVERTLFGLGFNPFDLPRQTKEFSGGWRMRIELAKLLLKAPDLLLLDEPTNHLDIESIQWLEDFLKDYKGAVIMISHDKAFLDNVTTRTIEISLGKIYDYKVPFSKYVGLRKEVITTQLAAQKNQQKMIADTNRFIERFRYKESKAPQVQSRIKQLEKLEKIEVDQEDLSAIRIRFPDAPRSGNTVIDADHISKKYGDKTVLDDIELFIRRGERIAFVGKNGEGKTTLSRILAGNLDYGGNLKIGQKVKIGYFAQDQDELLDEDITVFETINIEAAGDIGFNIRTLLGAFLFKNDDIEKKVKVLSGGERSRLALIKLLLQPYNLLILDEPTNHLDMRSKDILKNALNIYTGTLILVSHDREFLEGLADSVYEFNQKKIKKYLGDINYFLEKKKVDSLHQIEVKQNIKQNIDFNLSDRAGKESYLEKKEFFKTLRRITKSISTCETLIESLEEGLKELAEKIDKLSQDKIGGNDQAIFLRYAEQKKELDSKLLEWEKLHSELKELQKNEYFTGH